jgi:hypothetical protein
MLLLFGAPSELTLLLRGHLPPTTGRVAAMSDW